MSYPSFCDPDYPNGHYRDYKGYEIWKCTTAKFDPDHGIVYKTVYYEKTHPSESAAYTVGEVEKWIDDNLVPVPPTYNLGISAQGGGSTDPAPGVYTFDEGENVSVLAIPLPGDYYFDHWTLDGVEYTSNPITVVMDDDHSLVAYFSTSPPPPPPKFNLTISVSGEGTTDPPPGVYEYESGVTVTVTASGGSFDHWMLDGVSRTENPVDVVMDADHTLQAVFLEEKVEKPRWASFFPRLYSFVQRFRR